MPGDPTQMPKPVEDEEEYLTGEEDNETEENEIKTATIDYNDLCIDEHTAHFYS